MAKKPIDKCSQAATELHFEDISYRLCWAMNTANASGNKRSKKIAMIQSLVATCLPAYVALRCPFYLPLMGTLRCKVLDQHKKKKKVKKKPMQQINENNG